MVVEQLNVEKGFCIQSSFPLLSTDGRNYRIIQVERDLRRSLVQPSVQSSVINEVKPVSFGVNLILKPPKMETAQPFLVTRSTAGLVLG